MANIGIKTKLKLSYQPQLVQLPNTQKKSLSVSFKIVLELTKSEIFGGWCGVAEHNRLGKAQQDERETVFIPASSRQYSWLSRRRTKMSS